MDYDSLYELLPKLSSTWTISDIEVWLKFIGYEQFIPQFKQASIDGSCLSQLTESDFRDELGIKSKIIVKKIMAWLTHGIRNYDKFIMQKKSILITKERSTMSHVQKQLFMQQKGEYIDEALLGIKSEKPIKGEMNLKLQSSLKGQLNIKGESFSRKRQMTEQQIKQRRQINELIIKQCEGSAPTCHSLKEHGAAIGRHPKAQIHVLDQLISRYHAQIQYDGMDYYLRDSGSSSGTFIRITEKREIKNGMIIEMGSNQFEIAIKNNDLLNMRIIQGANIHDTYDIPATQDISIGRKSTNKINFPDDQHLSNMHSTIYQIEGKWYIEDLSTTNGTWIRLSPENTESQRFLIEDKMQFKLGCNLTYQCHKSSEHRKTEKDRSDTCKICGLRDRSSIFLPCKHNACCYECTEINRPTHCITCGSTVNDIIRIYKV